MKTIICFFFSGTLIGLFSQVRNGGDIVRDRALKFLHMKIKTSGPELLSSKETEAVLLEEIKHSIEEWTADEFHMFMAMLAATSLQKSIRYYIYIHIGLIYLIHNYSVFRCELEFLRQPEDQLKITFWVQFDNFYGFLKI